jgi:hypothetical protein
LRQRAKPTTARVRKRKNNTVACQNTSSSASEN